MLEFTIDVIILMDILAQRLSSDDDMCVQRYPQYLQMHHHHHIQPLCFHKKEGNNTNVSFNERMDKLVETI